jgi:mono/diheme cytochrome c family protein
VSRGLKVTLWVVGGLAAAFVLIQFVPYGRDHTNPPVTAEYQWKSAEAKAVAEGACYDCHSNETVWPWYTNVAPSSWLVQRDVDEGRENLNFSEWPAGAAIVTEGIAQQIAEVVAEGEMPPFQYKIMHGDARLSDAERQLLVDEFSAQ